MEQASFTLFDPHTKEMALHIFSFNDCSSFNNLQKYNYFSLLLVSKGAGKVLRDGAEYEFGHDSLLCFAIYQPFRIRPEHEFTGVLINFHPGFFCLFKHRDEVSCNGILFNNLYETPVVQLNDGEMRALTLITGQMKEEMESREPPDQDVLLSYLKIFLINATRIKIEQVPRDVARNKELSLTAENLRIAIEGNFRRLRSPGDYGRLLHISTKALNKVSKSYFNKTLTSLIAERLIIEAKRELYLTAKPVKQIAFELGYIDEFYFSRFFKKNAGVSPQTFRVKVGFDKLIA